MSWAWSLASKTEYEMQSNVGAGLPAIAVGQCNIGLTDRLLSQASQLPQGIVTSSGYQWESASHSQFHTPGRCTGSFTSLTVRASAARSSAAWSV